MGREWRRTDQGQRKPGPGAYTCGHPEEMAMYSPLQSLYRVATGVARNASRWVPYSAQKPVLSLALNEALREPRRNGDLDFLEGHSVRIRVDDLAIDWLIGIEDGRLRPLDRKQDEDVRISGELGDFTLLATRQADPDTLFFQRRIRIEGDTELGLGVKNTMDSVDWDDLPLPLRTLLGVVARFLQQLAAMGGAHPA
jgi:predicted lipid carrier protein YhbT